MRFPAFTLCFLPFAGLTSCATIINGTTQPMMVNTTDNIGTPLNAQCDLSNTRGDWTVTTPASVTVHRSYSALQVKCIKSGYEEADQKVKSTTSEAFAGNVLAGGLVGDAVDAENGSAYDYPESLTIPMTPAPATPVPTAATGKPPGPVAAN